METEATIFVKLSQAFVDWLASMGIPTDWAIIIKAVIFSSVILLTELLRREHSPLRRELQTADESVGDPVANAGSVVDRIQCRR